MKKDELRQTDEERMSYNKRIKKKEFEQREEEEATIKSRRKNRFQ